MIVEDQSEVIAFLSRPDTWGLPGSSVSSSVGNSVKRVETHASVVFLAGERAFKLKRSVRFPYLDFSTAAKRRRFCEAEVSINQRTAPDLYRGVIPVVRRNDGTLTLDGPGTPVDWVIEMIRFDEDALFTKLAANGRLDRFAMECLADAVAEFHATAERETSSGGAAGIAAILASNAACFRDTPADLLDRDASEALVTESEAALARVTDLLNRRRETGLVRRCHGDLHLRNIVVRDGRPELFDAIEFDPALSNIDVLYDVAFLVMDLEFRGHRSLASVFLNRYLDDTGDAAGLAALPLFLSMRAAIRSHVEAAAALTQSSTSNAEHLVVEARRYLEMARAVLAPTSPRLVAVGGLSGTGKSRLARELAPLMAAVPGARVVRTDATRKRLAGVAPTDRLSARSYTEDSSRQTYAAVLSEAEAVLAAGRPVIIDAVFAKLEERAAVAALAQAQHVPFQGLWLTADPSVMERRVSGRRHNVSDATPEVVRMQLTYDLGPIDWARLETADEKASVLAAACRLLHLPQPLS